MSHSTSLREIAKAIQRVLPRRVADQLRLRRVVLFVGERLTASVPVLTSSSISLVIHQQGANGKGRSERVRLAYGPHNLLFVSWLDHTWCLGLRDVDYAEQVRGELNLPIFDQILHVHATQDELTLEFQITRPPIRPKQPTAAVKPRFKIIARRAA